MTYRTWVQPAPIGDLVVTVGQDGVAAITLPGGTHPVFSDERVEIDLTIAAALDAYFEGDLTRFDVPVDLGCVTAPFHRVVLETLYARVGYGETVSYGELALMAGRPRAARAVGTAMNHNPVPIIVACHRVVASNGIGGYGAGLTMKRQLLALEGNEYASR